MDDLDRKILSLLAKNARMPVKEIAEAGESYRTVSGRTLIFFSTSFIMLKREVAVKLPAFVFVIDTLQHNRYN